MLEELVAKLLKVLQDLTEDRSSITVVGVLSSPIVFAMLSATSGQSSRI